MHGTVARILQRKDDGQGWSASQLTASREPSMHGFSFNTRRFSVTECNRSMSTAFIRRKPGKLQAEGKAPEAYSTSASSAETKRVAVALRYVDVGARLAASRLPPSYI